jgi:hypothetical protein
MPREKLSDLVAEYAKKKLPTHSLFSPMALDIDRRGPNIAQVIRANALGEEGDPLLLVKPWSFLLSHSIRNLKLRDEREFPGGADMDMDQVPFGIDQIRDYFSDFIEFERLLYGTSRHYREHIKHVFRVWLLGAVFLDRYFENGDSYDLDLELPGAGGAPSIVASRAEIDAAWCIASLCHDLGYPLAKIARINQELRKMLAYFGGVQFSDFSFQFSGHNRFLDEALLKIIASRVVANPMAADAAVHGAAPAAEPTFTTALQTKYYLKLSRSFEDFAHGLISCSLVFKNLIYFLETDYAFSGAFKLSLEDCRQFVLRREILRSMAAHTCPEIFHWRAGSLPFLLFIVDEMQFWGRPTFDKMVDQFEPPEVYIEDGFTRNNIVFTIEVPTKARGGAMNLFFSKARVFKRVLRTGQFTHQRNFVADIRIVEKIPGGATGANDGYKYRIITTKQGAQSFAVFATKDEELELKKLTNAEPGGHEVLEDADIDKRLSTPSP